MLVVDIEEQLILFILRSHRAEEDASATIVTEECIFSVETKKVLLDVIEKKALLISRFIIFEELDPYVVLADTLAVIEAYNHFAATVLQDVRIPRTITAIEALGYRKLNEANDYYKLTRELENAKS